MPQSENDGRELRLKPWEEDEAASRRFKAAAREAELESLYYPDIPTPVDPDVAEFMGASEDPSFGDGDTYPDPEYLEWLTGIVREDDDLASGGGR